MFEYLPPSRKKPSKRPNKAMERRKEVMKEVLKEKEEEEKEDNERVAEKLMDEIELMGIKCPRCASRNVKELTEGKADEASQYHHLFCVDCKKEWKEKK